MMNEIFVPHLCFNSHHTDGVRDFDETVDRCALRVHGAPHFVRLAVQGERYACVVRDESP